MQFNKNKLLILSIILLAIIGAAVWYFAFFSIEEETLTITNDVRSSMSVE